MMRPPSQTRRRARHRQTKSEKKDHQGGDLGPLSAPLRLRLICASCSLGGLTAYAVSGEISASQQFSRPARILALANHECSGNRTVSTIFPKWMNLFPTAS